MNRGAVDGKVIAFLALALVMGGILLKWQIQAERMEVDFAGAMRRGEVERLPIELSDKVWSDAELAAAQALTLDKGTGKERALERTIHTGMSPTIPPQTYAYQATITDSETGLKYIFGYRRLGPPRWEFVMPHADSMKKQLELRMERLPVPKTQEDIDNLPRFGEEPAEGASRNN